MNMSVHVVCKHLHLYMNMCVHVVCMCLHSIAVTGYQVDSHR